MAELNNEVSVVTRPTRVTVPIDISEQSQLSGFAFSARFLKEAKLTAISIPGTVSKGLRAFNKAELAMRIASDSDGSPAIGENSIKIWINNTHNNAGSNANYIWLYFGRSKKIKLWGVSRDRFPKGAILTWDLNQCKSYLETIRTDYWDEITLVNPSGDGIKIDRVRMVHSNVTILDWTCRLWLDNSKNEKYGKIGLTARILSKKLSSVSNNWIPQIHWAARELGKSDGTKYGTTSAWCSEFASWCLRKALWDTPTGSIGSQSMENYFNGLGRKYTKDQIINKDYILNGGDYLRFQWSNGGQHSGIFIKYIDSSANPTNETRFQTIEGNTGATVKVRTRKLKDLKSCGNTK